MSNHPDNCLVRRISPVRGSNIPAYSFGTLVTDPAQYAALLQSLHAGGFTGGDCEFLWIDNTGTTQTDAFRGLNAILNEARAPIVILCHQDVRLLADGRAAMDKRLAELGVHDETWAVAGNAGGVAPGRLAIRITDPHGANQHTEALPARVMSLDENLLIVRRDARVGFSRDLTGFHFYGADICLHAEQAGFSAYVIDFHLQHLSPGRKAADFYAAEERFRNKWSRAITPRWMQTTCSLMHLSSGPVQTTIARLVERPYAGLLRRFSARARTTRPA